MGIYDRDYYGTQQPRAGGLNLGRMRFLSFNAWLIIINCAVFFIDASLANTGVPVQRQVGQRSQVVGAANEVLDPDYRDARGQVVPKAATRKSGNVLRRFVLDRRSGEVIGYNEYVVMPPLQAFGHFSTARGFFMLEVWRLVTFQFLHANLTHLFFNMFGLFVFGGMVEQQLGSKRYAAFYLVCGMGGGVAYLALNFLGRVVGLSVPFVLFNDLYTPLVGASAGVFAVIVACAYIAPHAVVQLLFPPIPLKLKYMAYGYVGLAVLNLLTQGRNAGGDAAHLGGAIAGFFFIRNAHLLRDFFDIFGNSRRPKTAQPKRVGRRPGSTPDPAEIDRILGKVGTHGLASLTESEKRTLREATDHDERS